MRLISMLFILQSLSSCERGFLKVLSASYAKELCSCLYVEKQSFRTCEQYAKQIIKVDNFHIDEEKKIVVASAMGFISTSFYRGKRLGCSLP